MQVGNIFWKEHFRREVVVDWDDFIVGFCLFTEKHSKILLNETQKTYLKQLLDPKDLQQIDFGQFTKFMQEYWIVPSNRTNLFKLKFKPVSPKKLQDWQGLQIKIAEEQGPTKTYTMQSAVLKSGAASTPLRTRQFLRVGSAIDNDIKLNSIFVNPNHLKIVSIGDEFFMKDVAKSSRCKLKIDRTLLLKKGMVVSVGDYDLVMEAVNSGPGLQQKLSVYIDLDMKTADPKEIYRKYGLDVKMEQEPEPAVDDMASSESLIEQQQVKIVNRGPLELITINRRTQQYKDYKIQQTTTVGKSPACNIALPDIKIPLKACTIDYALDCWMLRPEEDAEMLVQLANREQIASHRPSNLQVIQKDYTVACGEYRLSFDYLLRPEQY